jgi:hypothetical protein
MKYVVMSMLAVTVLAVSVSAGNVVLWEDDFESYSAGTAIQDVAKWSTSAADGPIRINGYNEDSALGHRLLGSGLALDGNSNKEQGSGVGRVWSTSRASVPAPTANATSYTVAFDTIVQRGSNSNGTANSGLYINYGVGAEFGLHFTRTNGKGWGFINSGPGLANVGEYLGATTSGGVELGMSHDNGINHGVNAPTTASITLDKTTMMASATVGGYTFAPQAFDQAVWDGIDHLEIRNDIANPAHLDANYGMDLDNIVVSVSEIPEPATMGLALLALCGLAVIRRKR